MPANRLNRIVRLGILAFALAFFSAGAWLAVSRARHIASRSQAAGRILEVKSSALPSGRISSRVARVRYRSADGQSVEFTDALPNHIHRQGDEVTVLYDPRAPQDAEVYTEPWSEPGSLFLIGAMPVLIRLVWSYKDYKERKRRRRKGIPDEEGRMTWPATSRRPKLPG